MRRFPSVYVCIQTNADDGSKSEKDQKQEGGLMQKIQRKWIDLSLEPKLRAFSANMEEEVAERKTQRGQSAIPVTFLLEQRYGVRDPSEADQKRPQAGGVLYRYGKHKEGSHRASPAFFSGMRTKEHPSSSVMEAELPSESVSAVPSKVHFSASLRRET